MVEREDDERGDAPEESFAALLEASLSRAAGLEPGDRVTAKVLKVGVEWVLLDVGQKGEGVLDAREVQDPEGRPTVSPGDALAVYFHGRDESELRFTTRIGGAGSGTAGLEQAWRSGIPVEGRVEREIKGGYEVRLPGSVRAFCPFSQVGRARHEEPGALLGATLPFKITQFGERGRTIVVSRRELLEQERLRRREELRRSLKTGARISGEVTSIQRYGAFIDLGGLEGLLPIAEAGWARTADLADVLRVGQRVDVEVKTVDWERDRITLTLRCAGEDPWLQVAQRFAHGSTHEGTVARLTPFGAFVTVAPGVDGLVHVSRLGEGRRVSHPREVLREGQQLRVVVDEVDAARRRLTLSPAGAESAAAEVAEYVDRPSASMGTLGDALRASLERKRRA